MVMPASYVEHPDGAGMLARLLKVPNVTPTTVALMSGVEAWSWTIAEIPPDGWETPAIGDMAIHILHAEDETNAWLEIAGMRVAMHPGDSVLAYFGDSVVFAPRMLVVIFGGSSGSPRRTSRATHGVESFVGHNRRTTYDTTRNMAFDRWKLTQAITFMSDDLCPLICVFGSVAVTVANQIFLLQPGQSLTFFGQVDILPDGLAYVMTVWDPEYGQGVSAESWNPAED